MLKVTLVKGQTVLLNYAISLAERAEGKIQIAVHHNLYSNSFFSHKVQNLNNKILVETSRPVLSQ